MERAWVRRALPNLKLTRATRMWLLQCKMPAKGPCSLWRGRGRKNRLPQFVPRRRRRAEFKGQRKNPFLRDRDRIFVQPAASDDGVCLGAVLWRRLSMRADTCPSAKCATPIWATSPLTPKSKKLSKPTKFAPRAWPTLLPAAELLANGKILGWFQGRMEFGPRALGSRSILADPRDPEMNAKVNNAVKFREWWRPFAPSLLRKPLDEYLESATDSPFMVLTAQVSPEKRSMIPSVTHVDGSARPQTVERDVNPLYWRLISEFGQPTGVPVIMNTSFNLRGEPIVTSPTDAIRTFFSSGMDALVIGSFVVEK